MAFSWARGRFRYGHPSEMEQGVNEMLYGYVTHYTIGVGLALSYVIGWDLLVGGPAPPVWALAYGVATTVASYFFVFPSIGLDRSYIQFQFNFYKLRYWQEITKNGEVRFCGIAISNLPGYENFYH